MVIIGAAMNRCCHLDMTDRSVIGMLVNCGCAGQSGGGWTHCMGWETSRPQTGWLPVARALERMLAARASTLAKTVHGVHDEAVAARVGLLGRVIEDMKKIMARADYEDRIVILTTRREQVEEAYDIRSGGGLTDGYACSTGIAEGSRSVARRNRSRFPGRSADIDRTLKGKSLCLSYHTRALRAAMPEIGGVLAAERRPTTAMRHNLLPLVGELASRAHSAVEERYAMLFGRSPTLSLNPSKHVHGESRDSEGAMVSLIETYRPGGFDPATCELPDHLPPPAHPPPGNVTCEVAHEDRPYNGARTE